MFRLWEVTKAPPLYPRYRRYRHYRRWGQNLCGVNFNRNIMDGAGRCRSHKTSVTLVPTLMSIRR
jgi:hypothetical protein